MSGKYGFSMFNSDNKIQHRQKPPKKNKQTEKQTSEQTGQNTN